MDKIAANNHFVALRKEVKKAKAMVTGNLIRKINKLKQEKEKAADDALTQKIESKIDRIHSEMKLIKQLDLYDICKQATLKPGLDVWNKVLDASHSAPGERLIARIICKNNIQKRIKMFREENKDLDEWINEYIEYRERKREIREETGQRKSKKKPFANERNVSADKHNNWSRKKSKSEMRFKDSPRNRSKLSLEDLEVIRKVEDRHLHPSWNARRKEKNLVKMALEGKFKSQKIDLTSKKRN